ncbi:hypothetical protein AVDCRST_MAG94-1731, partial [uncultured Leptolyngbya sp.]
CGLAVSHQRSAFCLLPSAFCLLPFAFFCLLTAATSNVKLKVHG